MDQQGKGVRSAASQKLADAIAHLSKEFRQQLPQRIERARELLARAPDPAARSEREELQRLMHTLSGSAATFGHPQLGDAARALELHLNAGAAADWARAAELFAHVEDAAQLP